jgi:hypothetical protein
VLLGGPLDLSMDYDRRLAVGEAWGYDKSCHPGTSSHVHRQAMPGTRATTQVEVGNSAAVTCQGISQHEGLTGACCSLCRQPSEQ